MANTQEPEIIARFGTLLGAIVTLTRETGHPGWGSVYRWECQGCQDSGNLGPYQSKARDAANAHAGQCRALPPLPVGLGDVPPTGF